MAAKGKASKCYVRDQKMNESRLDEMKHTSTLLPGGVISANVGDGVTKLLGWVTGDFHARALCGQS